MPLFLVLLLVGAAVGGLAAYFLTRGDNKAPRAAPQPSATTIVRTVTRPSGKTTTVQQTVTTTPPASTTTPAAPPASPSSGTSGAALNDQGYARMRVGDYNGALPLLQQAVQKLQGVGYPNEAYANFNLGYTLLQLGRCGDAIPYLQRAQRLESFRAEPGQALKRAEKCR